MKDDDVSSELDSGISECSAKKTILVTEKPDDFLVMVSWVSVLLFSLISAIMSLILFLSFLT